MEWTGGQREVCGSRVAFESGNGGVLTSMGRQGEVGKREAGLVSVKNMEEVGRAGISLSLVLYMM